MPNSTEIPEIPETPFTGISILLQKALLEELQKEAPEADPELGASAAMKRIAARIEAGESNLHDALNLSDELALCLANAN